MASHSSAQQYGWQPDHPMERSNGRLLPGSFAHFACLYVPRALLPTRIVSRFPKGVKNAKNKGSGSFLQFEAPKIVQIKAQDSMFLCFYFRYNNSSRVLAVKYYGKTVYRKCIAE